MITAKQKAWKLFNKYYSYLKANLMNDKEAVEDAKVCALIAVDEIIENNLEYLRDAGLHNDVALNIDLSFWEEVKKEIELL
jgi:hypothetical protein